MFTLSNSFRHGSDYYTFEKITVQIGTYITDVGSVITDELNFYLIADSNGNVRVVSELPDDYYILSCNYGCYFDYRTLQYISNKGIPLAKIEQTGELYGTPTYVITYLKEFSESEKFYVSGPYKDSSTINGAYYLNNIIYNNYDREYKIVDADTNSVVHFRNTGSGIVEENREICLRISDIEHTYCGDYDGYSYYIIPYSHSSDVYYENYVWDVITNSSITYDNIMLSDFTTSDVVYQYNNGYVLKLNQDIDINSILFLESSKNIYSTVDNLGTIDNLPDGFNINNVHFDIEYLGLSEEDLAMWQAIHMMRVTPLCNVISNKYAVFLGDYYVGPQGLNLYTALGGTRVVTEKAIFRDYNIFGTEIRGSLKSFLASVNSGVYNIWDIDIDNKILYFRDSNGNITAKMDHQAFGVIPSMGYDAEIGGFYRYKPTSEKLRVDICTDNIFTDCISDINIPSNFTGRLEVCTYSSIQYYKPASTYNKAVYYYKNGVMTYYDDSIGSSYYGIASLTRHYLNDTEYTYSYDNYYNNLLGFQSSDGVRINASGNSTNGNSFVQEQVRWDDSPVYARWSVGLGDCRNKLYPQGSGHIQIIRNDVSYQYDGSIVYNKTTLAGNVDLISVQIPSASIDGNIDLVLYYPGYGMLNFIKTEDNLYQAAAVNESGVIPFVLFLKHDDDRTSTIAHNRACIRQVSDEPTLLDTTCIMQNYITPVFDVSNYIQLLLSDFNSDSVIDTEDVALHLQYLRDN